MPRSSGRLPLLIAFAALACGALGYFRYREAASQRANGDPSGTASGIPAPATAAPVAVTSPKPPSAASALRPVSMPSPGGQKNGDLIEFKVLDGLAVAYGDIILGRVEEGSTADHGVYDSPRPQLWERPEIPYAISPELPNPARVEKAIEYLRQHTPVNFVPYQDQRDALVFEPGTDNCLSAFGRTGGLQPVKLAPGCQWTEVLHEIMHALGFIHEQSRPDRDRYVQILWDNISEQYRSQFAIVPDSYTEAVRDTPFDYHSVMLYKSNTFALSPTLLSMRSVGGDMIAPTEDGLSTSDIERIKKLFDVQ